MGSTHDTTGRSYSYSNREPDDKNGVSETLDQILGEENEERDEVDESYDEFVEGTQITDLQGKTISERRDVIEEILEEDMAVEDSQLIGSFTRNTMVGPLREDSDADVMVVLDGDQHRNWVEQENGPRNCLNAVKRKIENDPRFSETEVTVDQNVVKVKYHDSTVEVVPAFENNEVPHADHPKDGWNLFTDASDGYAIPDTHGEQSWQGTNPRAYKNQFEARDQAHSGKVSDLSRTMKKWADNNDVPVRSYTMEVMVYNYFQQKSETGQPVPDSKEELVRDFTDTLPNKMKDTTREPIYNEAVDKGMSRGERKEAARKAQRMREKLNEARHLKKQGKTEEAKEVLQGVYGEGFN